MHAIKMVLLWYDKFNYILLKRSLINQNLSLKMHIACANGYISVLDFLINDCQRAIDNGVPIVPVSLATRDEDGWTPLHVATFWGHVI